MPCRAMNYIGRFAADPFRLAALATHPFQGWARTLRDWLLCLRCCQAEKKGGGGPTGPAGCRERLLLLRARAFPPPTGHPERSEGSRYMEIVAPLPIHTGRRERFRENDFLRCSGWMGPADNEYICRLRLTPSGSLRSPPTPFRGGQGRYGIGFCVSGAARQKKKGGAGPQGPQVVEKGCFCCAQGLSRLPPVILNVVKDLGTWR